MALNNDPMTALERRAVAALAAIMSSRLLGLFLILPVFALYAERLGGYTPALAGLALGAYGLTQAILQIPFGAASDRFGRRPLIVLGLIIFALGSAVAALADHIYVVILGRALQGAGAVSAVVIALIADLTRESQRTKSMAVVGITIGSSFILALLLGPPLDAVIGVPGIFWLTAVLAIVGIVLVVAVVPTPAQTAKSAVASAHWTRDFVGILRNRALLRLNIGIFTLHAALTSLFAVIPIALARQAMMAPDAHWKLYLPVMAASVLFLLPMYYLAERGGRLRAMFLSAIVLLAISQLILASQAVTLLVAAIALLVFFAGFNFLEAILPSLVSKTAEPSTKGTAIGVYSTFEFFGAFVGGAAGGYVFGAHGMGAVFVLNAALLAGWFAVALGAKLEARFRRRLLKLHADRARDAGSLAAELARIGGVRDAVVLGDQGVAYLTVDDRELDRSALAHYGSWEEHTARG